MAKLYYRNRYLPQFKHSGIFRWQWERFIKRLPKKPKEEIRPIEPDLSFIHGNNDQIGITWLGHSTVMLQIEGLNILTDPHFSRRASPFSFIGPKRHQKPGLSFEDLPKIHIVLISHNHFDHLDKSTVQRLIDKHEGIKFFVPSGVEDWFKQKIRGSIIIGPDRNVFALNWDDEFNIAGLNLHFLSVQHWSARSLWDRCKTLWGSWAVIHPRLSFWFSGDLGYSKDTIDIGERFGSFDLAAIAIGGYEPRWFMKDFHINPREAVQVMKDIKAKRAIGIHWGTFENLTDEALDQPPEDLEIALREEGNQLNFRALKHGETLIIT